MVRYGLFNIMEATYDNLNDEGYLIRDVMSEEEADYLAKDLIDYTFDIVFENRGYEVPRDHPLALNVLTDKNIRNSLIDDATSESVWENGNSRKPIISKSCGMFDGHYNLQCLEKINFSKRLYDISAEVMGTDKLVFRAGLERYSIKPGVRTDPQTNCKAQGANDMPKHIDSNLFDANIPSLSVNYPFRIQNLVCLSVGNDVAPKDSGTLNLLVNMHHYWDFARHILNPQYGLVTMPVNTSRFHVLPKDWDSKYLPNLKLHIEAYTLFLHDRERYAREFTITRQIHSFYEWLEKSDVRVPSIMKDIHWKPIVLRPGQAVYWHQYLPHQSLRNKSETPRIVAYHNLFPVPGPDWYNSEERRWLLEMATKAHFYYGKDNNNYPRDICNSYEYEYLRSNGLLSNVLNYIKENPLGRKLLGIDPYNF